MLTNTGYSLRMTILQVDKTVLKGDLSDGSRSFWTWAS